MIIYTTTANHGSCESNENIQHLNYSPSKNDRSCADNPPVFVPFAGFTAPAALNVLPFLVPFGALKGVVDLPKFHASNRRSDAGAPALDTDEPVCIGARPTSGGAGAGEEAALRLPIMPKPLDGRVGFNVDVDVGGGGRKPEPDGGCAAAVVGAGGSSSSMMLNSFDGAPSGPGMAAGSGEAGAGHRWPDFVAASSRRLRVCMCSAACDRRRLSREVAEEGPSVGEIGVGVDGERAVWNCGGGCRGGGCKGGTALTNDCPGGGCSGGGWRAGTVFVGGSRRGGCDDVIGFAGTRGGEGVASKPPNESSNPLALE